MSLEQQLSPTAKAIGIVLAGYFWLTTGYVFALEKLGKIDLRTKKEIKDRFMKSTRGRFGYYFAYPGLKLYYLLTGKK